MKPAAGQPDRVVRDIAPNPDAGAIGDLAKPRPRWVVIANNTLVRRLVVVVVLGLLWEGYARWADNPLMFPSLSETLAEMWRLTLSGELPKRVSTSIEVLLLGYGGGIAAAWLLAAFAVTTRIGVDVLTTLTSMFNPLPALALLPLALLWFGIGTPSMVFVMIQSVVWVVALSTMTGFLTVPETLRMAGQNLGLKGIRFVAHILVPAAFPSILSGLNLGWAFAWRTLIGAELIFGVASRSGGLGWFIFESRAQLETARVFAGLLAVVFIGLFVESVIFRSIEVATVRKWGMQRQ